VVGFSLKETVKNWDGLLPRDQAISMAERQSKEENGNFFHSRFFHSQNVEEFLSILEMFCKPVRSMVLNNNPFNSRSEVGRKMHQAPGSQLLSFGWRFFI